MLAMRPVVVVSHAILTFDVLDRKVSRD